MATVTPDWLLAVPMVITTGAGAPRGTPAGILAFTCSTPAGSPGAAPA